MHACQLNRSGRAHVALAAYSSNLQSLVQMMQSAGVQQVVLITPPPVWEDAPNARNPGEVGGYCIQLVRGGCVAVCHISR